MVACANASFAEDRTGWCRTVDAMTRDYASFVDCVPEQDVCIADAGHEIAGYVRCWPYAQADGLHLYAQLGVMAPSGAGVASAEPCMPGWKPASATWRGPIPRRAPMPTMPT